MDFFSPLRYPGGKGKISSYFKQIFKDNNLYDGVYVEPFAGGASIALSLLFNEYASKVVINDIDRSIYSFWYSVLNDTDNFCRMINDAPMTIDHWQLQKTIQKDKENQSLLDLGYSTFFLNRTNRSGIIKSGVIGGKDQSGDWKMDARFKKIDLIKRIERIAAYKNKIKLYNLDAVKLIEKVGPKLPQKSLFYFDPPYYVKGKDLYLNYFNHDDHELIYKAIKRLDKKWIVTYDNIPQITTLYNGFRQHTYTLNYSVANSQKGIEVMIYSDNIIPSPFKSQYSLFE